MVLSGVGYTVGLAGRSHPTCLNVRGRGQLCRPAGRRAVSTAAATRYDVSRMVLMAIGDDRRRSATIGDDGGGRARSRLALVT
jgi:hypothetical protein